jgi:hypothetical protein
VGQYLSAWPETLSPSEAYDFFVGLSNSAQALRHDFIIYEPFTHKADYDFPELLEEMECLREHVVSQFTEIFDAARRSLEDVAFFEDGAENPELTHTKNKLEKALKA